MSTPTSTPRILCIGGAPSSGTTLLADLLDAVPGVLCGPELNLFCTTGAFEFDDAFRLSYKRKQPLETNACYSPHSRFFNTKHLEQMGMDHAALDAMIEESGDLGGFISRLCLRFAEFRGRDMRVFAEKTPINVTHAATFCRRFPTGLFVHVVRDGRAVVASLMRRGYTLWEAAMIWMLQTRAGRDAAQRFPNIIEIRYEDLLSAPYMKAASIARLCGLEAAPAEIERAFAQNVYRSGLPRVESWSASTYNGQIAKPPDFRDQLTPKQIALIENLCVWRLAVADPVESEASFFEHLRYYGYDTQVKTRPRISMNTMAREFRTYLEQSSNLAVQADLMLMADNAACRWSDVPWQRIQPWLSFSICHDQTRLRRLIRRLGLMGAAQIAIFESVRGELNERWVEPISAGE